MSRLSIECKCDKCHEDFDIVLEWLGKYEAIDKLKHINCPMCCNEDWHFTDCAEH